MKKIIFYGFILFSATLVINSGCTTEETFTTTPIPTNNTPIPPKTGLSVNAGEDYQVILPTDYIRLEGSYSYIGNIDGIDSFVWKKISGPSTYILESPNSLSTKVSKMGKGIYEFEFTITDKSGLIDKDTATVTVGELSSTQKEIIFKDMAWSCPWDCRFGIENIYSQLSVGSVFRVYIQRDNSADWREVIHTSQWSETILYYYSMYNGILYIHYYGPDVGDTPNIKIVY